MLEISGMKIGVNYQPFVIAEMSGNHNQSLDRASKERPNTILFFSFKNNH